MAANNRERLLLIAAFIVLLIFAGDRFVIQPLIAPWKARNQRIAELKQMISNGQMLQDRKEAINERWTEMRQRSLPTQRSSAENQVLNAVGMWARTSRLNVTDMKPRWIVDENLPDRIEIRLSAVGDMPSIARFLYEMEKDPTALKLEDLQIRARDEKTTQLSLESRFTGLVLKGGNG